MKIALRVMVLAVLFGASAKAYCDQPYPGPKPQDPTPNPGVQRAVLAQ